MLADFCLRYVDETFLYNNDLETEVLHLVLKGLHRAIRFTCEKESDSALSFLDVLIQKQSYVCYIDVPKTHVYCIISSLKFVLDTRKVII